MALVQDAPFRDYQEIKLDVLLVDLDRDSLAMRLKEDFKESGNVNFVLEKDSITARAKINTGDYKVAIIIPADATQNLQMKSKEMVSKLLKDLGLNADSAAKSNTVNISILFDPIIKANYKQTVSTAVDKILTRVQTEWIIRELQNQLGTESAKKTIVDLSEGIKINPELISENKLADIALNSVQHNIPAWAMFAMFFILFPLAANFIKEREDGSMMRLKLISNSYFPVIMGKFSFYFLICLLQFVSMIIAGLYFMPVLGLEKLYMGENIPGIIIAASVVSMAATSYGLLIAAYFKTPQQALSFGSISVVILAAIGGIWVPVFVMPPVLQSISVISPLNWGLEVFNDLFLRGSSIKEIIPGLLKLLTFSGVALSLSIFVHKVRTGV
jgi:ABC-2 type transport system permease protein